MDLRSGRVEGMPYSLSRWTDVPHAKWPWMQEQFAIGHMIAFDQRTGVPARWSLKPEDTEGLIWWTKDPTNLMREVSFLKQYKNQVHVTITGWEEVEKGVPSWKQTASRASILARALGPEHEVIWRFSPVPLLDRLEVSRRFEAIAAALEGRVNRVYLSFLQANDLIGETRDRDERLTQMVDLAKIGAERGIKVLLCNEDSTLSKVTGLPDNLASGVCSPPEFWGQPGAGRLPSEGCGCVMMVDPFTVNESCTFGCKYCYAADETLSGKKRNTTRSLTVLH